jgi:hypothetical protein
LSQLLIESKKTGQVQTTDSLGLISFKPIKKNPGDVIRSEDWNKMQEDIRSDFERIMDFISKLSETVVYMNLESPTGQSFLLSTTVPGEKASYESPVLGLITKQWILPGGQTGEICRFGCMTSFDVLNYWSGAENGDKKALAITLDYVDGTSQVFNELFLHDRSRLRPTGKDNPYVEYLLSPNDRVWYMYQLENPNPEKEVRYITFKNVYQGCTPRIANVLQFKSRIKPMEILAQQ